MPRSNTTSSDASPRPRSRGPARSSSTLRRAAGADEAADRTLSTQSAGDGSSTNPTFDEIAEAAYHRYLKRGGSDGGDFDDWVEAERELRSRRQTS